jgi:hypothetical protein
MGSSTERSWSSSVLPRAVLSALAIAPYFELLTMQGIVATDDYIYSDILSAELPGRAEIGAMYRAGQLPLWTEKLCGGLPLHAAGGAIADPIGVSIFTALPPAIAVNLYMLVIVLIAAHGAYSLARRLGASIRGAVLAGFAFAQSGVMVCQLKHLGIVATICWVPAALACLDRALGVASPIDDAPPTARDRQRSLALFCGIFGLQVLQSFPQSAYISALVYGVFALARTVERARVETPRPAIEMLAWSAIAAIVGVAIGAVALLPMAELGAQSPRSEGLSYAWATALHYAKKNAWMFVSPYANGDESAGTYAAHGIFWEDYGYVGRLVFGLFVASIPIAIVTRRHRRDVALFTAIAVGAYLIVLGPATPIFKIVFNFVPGMHLFRFPTRFLFVVDLCIVLLAAIALTEVERWIRDRVASAHPERVSAAIGVVVIAVTFVDLWIAQRRQNPTVEPNAWLAPPRSVQRLAGSDATRGEQRIYTPAHISMHVGTALAAHGWRDMRPFFQLRELVEPNTNLLYGLSTADCYSGIEPRGVIATWGDHNTQDSLIARTFRPDLSVLDATPAFFKLLAMHAVGYVLTPAPATADRPIDDLAPKDSVHVYRLRDAMPRAFVVPRAWRAIDDAAAGNRILADAFDPRREVVVEDFDVEPALAAGAAASDPTAIGEAKIERDLPSDLEISTHSSTRAWLVLADTWYPGWEATVDGAPTPIARANLSDRAVVIPAGEHRVHFHYAPRPFAIGATISLAAIGAWAVAMVVSRRRTASPAIVKEP